MSELKFYEFTMEELANFVYEMRIKKKLSKTSKKIFKKLQEISEKEALAKPKVVE